jgi:outer membrane protein
MRRAWRWIGPIGLAAAPALALAAQAPGADSLTLERAITLAQRQGPSALIAVNTRDAARWTDRDFHAQLLPRLSLSGEVPNLLRRIESVTQPDGQIRFVPLSQAMSSLTLKLDQQLPFTGGQLYFTSSLTRIDLAGSANIRSWQSSPIVVGLRQQIFRPNTAAWDAREQRLRSATAEREYLEAREDVALATVGAFFDAFAAKLTVDNLAANAAVNDTLYRLNQGRYNVGKIGENDLLQSQLALLRARNDLDAARLAAERTLAALKIQLGLAGHEPIALVPPSPLPAFPVDTAAAVTAALSRQSAILGQELQTVQARRRVREARLNNGFGATVTVEAGYNQTAPGFQDAYRSLLGQQSLSVGVEMPLLQWGAGHARVAAARAQEDRAASATRLERDRIAQDAHFAALELAQSQRGAALSATADTVAAKRFDVAKNRYVIGKIGIDNLFVAQSEKDAALQAYIQSLRAYWTGYFRLRKLTLHDFATGREIT